jgi:hypothetical protein
MNPKPSPPSGDIVPKLDIEFQFQGTRFKTAAAGLASYSQFIGGGMKRAAPELKKALRVYLNSTVFALLRQHSGRWPGGTSDNSLSRRSGGMGKSIRASVRVDGAIIKDIEGRIGGNRIARVHEFGAIIRHKKKEYLTIPLKAALDSRGIPKRTKARDWKNTFVGKSKRGNLLIFQKRASGLVPLYALKKMVVIPPRLGMGRTLEVGKAFFVDTSLQAMANAVVKGK